MPRGFLRRVGQYIRLRIGWRRIGIVLSILIISLAFHVLWKMLRGIDLAEVGEAIAATPVTSLVLAGVFVAFGYWTLTFYDWLALHTIGKGHIPYRIAAMAGFTSYSIGHNVGATVFTGGTIRYRIYSEKGLTLLDVARLAFVAGLTFWLGNITVLGIGITIHPEAASAVDQLPPLLNRALAIGALCGLVGYVVWIGRTPRVYGRGNWYVTLPSRLPTIVQICIGVVDLSFCALAMFVLMPPIPETDFITVAVVFVSATLLGFASHAPGGIGVFDAAMIVALTSGKWGMPVFDKEDLLAALLLFRIFYYLMPLMVSALVLAARELYLGGFAGLRAAVFAPTPAAPEDTAAAHQPAERREPNRSAGG